MKFGNQTVQNISRPINSWNLCQIGIKSCYIPRVSKFNVEKGYLCQQA